MLFQIIEFPVNQHYALLAAVSIKQAASKTRSNMVALPS
jgi:hypothetical protein